MKSKKILILLLILLVTPVLVSCDVVWNIVNTTSTPYTSTLPEEVDGLIELSVDDYENFGVYESIIYNTDDVDEFYDHILDTQAMIRHANIEVLNTYYNFGGSGSVISGSGFIFMEDDNYYYAITNHHVIENDGVRQTIEIKAYGDDENYYPADIIASDENLDLAVLKFSKNSRSDIVIIDIYERLFYKYNQGEVVLAVGNPKDVYNIVTVGELISLQSLNDVDFYIIYHNAQIDEGSSGGALVDIDGNLIGVNTWGYDSDEVYSFSVPNYKVYEFLVNNEMIENEIVDEDTTE